MFLGTTRTLNLCTVNAQLRIESTTCWLWPSGIIIQQKNHLPETKDKSNLKVTEYLLYNSILHPSSCGAGAVVRSFIRWKPVSSPTFARTVWIYSKWLPSCWNVMGLWLKNHWNVTSREVSCVALQLSTTLSPTVTSTLCGLSSTRMASVSTMLLHCHPRQTRTYWADVQFDCEPRGRAKKETQTT